MVEHFIHYKIIFMAVVINSLILKGISGKIGELVVKQYEGKTIVCTCPVRSVKALSEKQEKQRAKFKSAVRWAQEVIANENLLAKYKEQLRKGQTVFHYLVGEYMRGESVCSL